MPRQQALTPEEKQTIRDLYKSGLTGHEIAKKTGYSKTCVYNHLNLDCEFRRRWTEDEKERVVNLYAKGKSLKEIARQMRRSETAVKIFMCRYRKEVRSDPAKRKALHLITFALKHTNDPGKAISAVRKSRIYGRNDDVLQL